MTYTVTSLCPFAGLQQCSMLCAFYEHGCLIYERLAAGVEPKQAVLEFDPEPVPMPAICKPSERDRAVRAWIEGKPASFFVGQFTAQVHEFYKNDVAAGLTPDVGEFNSKYLTYRVRDVHNLKTVRVHGLMKFVEVEQ